jgi:hypothetical protein
VVGGSDLNFSRDVSFLRRGLRDCQADRALVATVWNAKELKERHGAKRKVSSAIGSRLPCERLSFQCVGNRLQLTGRSCEAV